MTLGVIVRVTQQHAAQLKERIEHCGRMCAVTVRIDRHVLIATIRIIRDYREDALQACYAFTHATGIGVVYEFLPTTDDCLHVTRLLAEAGARYFNVELNAERTRIVAYIGPQPRYINVLLELARTTGLPITMELG